ncbi:MAG: type II toxin-antitoxin system VapC family toxin [Coriobacteriales bacterium]
MDCSAALQIAKKTDRGKAYESLFLSDEEVVAPTLYALEAASTAWKYVRSGLASVAEGRQLMDDVLSLPDRLYPTEELMDEIYTEGAALDHSVYDMAYLVLARRMGATLCTYDARLIECCEKRDVDHIVEVEFTPAPGIV